MEDELLMLSTFDNPWSPFDEYEQWAEFDEIEKGYHTMQFLDRSVRRVENGEDYDEEIVRNAVIKDIVKRNPFGIHIMLTREDAKNMVKQRENRKTP